jgi:hypothetical protein
MNFDNSSPKYPDKPESREEKIARLKTIEQELFGNETKIGDRLAIQEGISVPNSYNGDVNNGSSTDRSGCSIESTTESNSSDTKPIG